MTPLDAGAERRLDEWLRGLKWSLSPIPSPEREDILEETRGHIAERVGAGASVDEVLTAFGTPEQYARRFVDDMQVSQALGAAKAGPLLGVIMTRLHRSALAIGAFAVLLILGVVAFSAVSIIWFEITDPVHTGLWMNDRGTAFIGIIDDPQSAEDRLGAGVIPVAIFLLTLSAVLARLTLVGVVRRFSRR